METKPDYNIADETDYATNSDTYEDTANIYGTVNFYDHVEFRDPKEIAGEVEKKLNEHYAKLLEAMPSLRVVVLNYRIQDTLSPDCWWLDYSVEDKDGDDTIQAESRVFWKRILNGLKTEWEKRPVDYIFREGHELKTKGKCPSCKEDINPKEFKDRLSYTEYTISGMCQSCQDKVFDDISEEVNSWAT